MCRRQSATYGGGMSLNAPTETHWEQPDFATREPAPLTGVVVVPQAQHWVAAQVPPAGPEELRLQRIAAWLWPVALVLCVVGGSWWPLLAVAFVVSVVLRHRLRELRRQRLVHTRQLR